MFRIRGVPDSSIIQYIVSSPSLTAVCFVQSDDLSSVTCLGIVRVPGNRDKPRFCIVKREIPNHAFEQLFHASCACVSSSSNLLSYR